MSLQEIRPQKKSEYGELTIEGTRLSVGSRLLGWRITTTDRVTDQAHEYWVQDGRIHHVLLTPAQSGSKGADFVIGRLVRRIPALSKNAILKAINEWNAAWI